MSENSTIIKLENISKHFHDHVALDHVSLDIKNGEFLTLLGPSGCGKTTLLRVISGFEIPDSGRVILNNEDITQVPPEQRYVNTVFQNYALFPHMSAYENVAFGLRCSKTPKHEIKRRVMDVLRMVQLEPLAHRMPAELSGGQKQRVAIARAVVNEPWVLLLDEPLSALDYKLRKSMQIELKTLQRRLGITFIFVTHDQEEALSMSDRVVVMNEGRILQIGRPRDIYEEPASLFAARFVGETNIFETTVHQLDNGTLSVEIEGKIFHLKNTKNFKAGDAITVIVRPEDIGVWTRREVTDTTDMISGTVEQVVYKGSTVDLVVRLPSQKLISATEFFNEDDEKLEYEVGETVWIRWMSGWEVVLPHEH